ncbi:carbon-nitrogen hydrolase family protein [Motilimonas sp. 1_MG-2023]|uniref:carbon-nitrogen hydrolase family protein n=1 Tax=Motilimonas sp. 1_MG-2023 TaxID=3062672 RepID=UPI0026E2003B|nr:carbon-nitrogen hydrolase family protein [Motilimonas sp. 1_MG-2023]MDO6524159.1 carbon-nitrogen hydrolase family protein [Motilimonas sp. 1_MG-2023]
MNNVSLIQLISCSKSADNLARIEQLLYQLAPKPKQWVLLPENAIIFGVKQDYLAAREKLGDGPLQDALAKLAQRFNIYLVCGSFPIESEEADRVYTSSLVFSPQGQLIKHYHKLHLFDAQVADGKGSYQESATFKPGNQLAYLNENGLTLGLTICYDLRFPALFQQLRQAGAQVIFVPAAFTYVTGKAHWLPLLQARAIETQCYIVAANQGGDHSKERQTWGHSCIIDPWGEIVDQLELGEGGLSAAVDLTKLDDIRRRMPVMEHQRIVGQRLNEKD